MMVVNAAPKSLPELIRVAAAASRSNIRVSFTGVRSRPLEELVQIAAAGGDCVSFVREREETPLAESSPRWRLFRRRGA